MSARASRSQAKGSVSQLDTDTLIDAQEQDVAFKLSFLEALDDPQVAAKLGQIVANANAEVLGIVSSLREEVSALKSALADRDAVIAELRAEVQEIQQATDDNEQHDRRHSLRISGIGDQEDTTAAMVSLANNVLNVQPPLVAKDISVSHRLRKPRRAKPDEPAPVIVRFVSRSDRDRVIRQRRHLIAYNEGRDIKTYINEDLTIKRAKLFAIARTLYKDQIIKQAWTYNGKIKFTTLNGEVKSATTLNDLKQLFPDNIKDVKLWQFEA